MNLCQECSPGWADITRGHLKVNVKFIESLSKTQIFITLNMFTLLYCCPVMQVTRKIITFPVQIQWEISSAVPFACAAGGVSAKAEQPTDRDDKLV